MNLQEEMIKCRAENDMSQKEFAILAGLSLQTVNSVENGMQKPTKLTEQKIRLAIERSVRKDDSEYKPDQDV